jgi:hypothetical protein
MLSRLGRWALGLYPPAVPTDLRLTEIRPTDAGLSQIVSKVEIPASVMAKLRTYQQRQHDTRGRLQEMIQEREMIEMEREP